MHACEPGHVPPRHPNVACCAVAKGLTAFMPHVLQGEAGLWELPRLQADLWSFWKVATAGL